MADDPVETAVRRALADREDDPVADVDLGPALRRRIRHRTRISVVIGVVGVLALVGGAVLAIGARSDPATAVRAGPGETTTTPAEDGLRVALLDGTVLRVDLPGEPAAAPAVSLSAPIDLGACCPYATAEVDSTSAPLDGDVLGSWELGSGQPAVLVRYLGVTSIVITAGAYRVEVPVPGLDDPATAEAATADLAITEGGDGLPVLPVVERQGDGAGATIDLGAALPFVSIHRTACTDEATRLDPAPESALATRCLVDAGVEVAAQATLPGDDPDDLVTFLEAVRVEVER